jgi:predicted nucleic acid-binding protein
LRVYLDTSVVVSLLCGDSNHARAVAALASDKLSVVLSDWTGLEFASVLARLTREGRITEDDARALLAVYDRWTEVNGEVIPLSTRTVAVARALVSEMRFNLRGPDALHIAISLEGAMPVMTFDIRMAEAARAIGLDVFKV